MLQVTPDQWNINVASLCTKNHHLYQNLREHKIFVAYIKWTLLPLYLNDFKSKKTYSKNVSKHNKNFWIKNFYKKILCLNWKNNMAIERTYNYWKFLFHFQNVNYLDCGRIDHHHFQFQMIQFWTNSDFKQALYGTELPSYWKLLWHFKAQKSLAPGSNMSLNAGSRRNHEWEYKEAPEFGSLTNWHL